MYCRGLNASIVWCEQEQTLNSEECSELAGTLTSSTMKLRVVTNGSEVRRVETTDMMLFNNGYGVSILNTSSMMDNTLQMMIQQPAASSLDLLWEVSGKVFSQKKDALSSWAEAISACVHDLMERFELYSLQEGSEDTHELLTP